MQKPDLENKLFSSKISALKFLSTIVLREHAFNCLINEREEVEMSIKKTFYPEKGVCRVIFTLPDSLVDHVKKVAIVGDFNDWHPEKHPMKKLKNGKFEFTLELPLGKDYQFRYLLNSYKWESDIDADELVPTPFPDVYNSVIKCNLP